MICTYSLCVSCLTLARFFNQNTIDDCSIGTSLDQDVLMSMKVLIRHRGLEPRSPEVDRHSELYPVELMTDKKKASIGSWPGRKR